MPKFVKVANASEIEPGQMKPFTVNSIGVVIANWQGTFFATQDLCTHDDGTLSDGELVEGEIECPRHGARFDLQSGRATLPAAMAIKTFPVKIEDGIIMVAID